MDLLLPTIPKGTYFEYIPLELIREILLYLNYPELVVLEVSEDLFWRLKITRDFPNFDLDLILYFLSYDRPFCSLPGEQKGPFKSKNLRNISTIVRKGRGYEIFIINDDPKYYDDLSEESPVSPKGRIIETYSMEELIQFSYLIGIKFPIINLYKAIYYYIDYFKNRYGHNQYTRRIPSDKDLFIHQIYIINNINKITLSNMIKRHLSMSDTDRIAFGLQQERFSYMIPKY